jgi:hypothetical protein
MSDVPLTLSHLAQVVANDVGGKAHSLDEVGDSAFAIDVGGQHALLLLAHPSSFALSLPPPRQWSVSTMADWSAVQHDVTEVLRGYRAAHPRTPGMADALLVLAPLLRELTGKTNSVRFPGTPHPTEGWVQAGTISVGVFLVGKGLQVVVWVEGEARSHEIQHLGQLTSLAAWARPHLEAQRSRGPDAPKSSEPTPEGGLSFEEVMTRLRGGARFKVAGSRYEHLYFFEDGRVLCDFWEEGTTRIYEVSERELRSVLARNPNDFR